MCMKYLNFLILQNVLKCGRFIVNSCVQKGHLLNPKLEHKEKQEKVLYTTTKTHFSRIKSSAFMPSSEGEDWTNEFAFSLIKCSSNPKPPQLQISVWLQNWK